MLRDFPGGTSGKESICNVGDKETCVGKIPWRRVLQSTPVFLLGEAHGQKGLVGYGPQGGKELDATETT